MKDSAYYLELCWHGNVTMILEEDYLHSLTRLFVEYYSTAVEVQSVCSLVCPRPIILAVHRFLPLQLHGHTKPLELLLLPDEKHFLDIIILIA